MSILSSISPLSGAPGRTIALTGSGFLPTSQVACPALVQTTYVSSTQLTAAIPALQGQSGTSMQVAVFVSDANGLSNMLMFTVLFPAVNAQSFTTIDRVCAEVPGFSRGGQIDDDTIQGWIVSVSQSVAGQILRRGLPLDPTQWAQPDPQSVSPTPQAVLEQIARYGAAARLASAVSSQFSAGGQWGYATNLQNAFQTEFKLFCDGHYDKLFFPAAATVDPSPLVATGEVFTSQGYAAQAFHKHKIF